jgi:hypothetical protein
MRRSGMGLLAKGYWKYMDAATPGRLYFPNIDLTRSISN